MPIELLYSQSALFTLAFSSLLALMCSCWPVDIVNSVSHVNRLSILYSFLVCLPSFPVFVKSFLCCHVQPISVLPPLCDLSGWCNAITHSMFGQDLSPICLTYSLFLSANLGFRLSGHLECHSCRKHCCCSDYTCACNSCQVVPVVGA